MHYLALVDEPFYSPLNALVNAFRLMRNPERVTHPGMLHPDKTFYVITDLPPDTGIASWHDRVAGYVLRAQKKGWVPVVSPQPPAQADSGTWYDYFKPVSDVPLEEAIKGKNVVFATTQAMIYKRYNRRNVRKRNAVALRRIALCDRAQRFVDERLPPLMTGMAKPVVGVRFRGTDYRVRGTWRPTGHATVPDVAAFCDTVAADMARWGVPVGEGEHIFLMTEEQEAFEQIRKRFPKCGFVERERFANFDFGTGRCLCYHRLPHTTPYENNLNYLLEIYALSQCDYLVGGYNGGVLVACNLNGNAYKGVHILKTGVS